MTDGSVRLIAGIAGGFLAGIILVWLLIDSSGDETGIDAGPAAVIDREEEEAPEARRSTTPPDVAPAPRGGTKGGDDEAGSGSDDELFSPALMRYARERIIGGWRRLRKQDDIPEDQLDEALEKFRQQVLELPEALGAAAARVKIKQEEAYEDLRTGGVYALLEKIEKEAGPMLDLVRDDDEYDRLFGRDVDESLIDGRLDAKAMSEALADGVTLTLPPGVYSLENFKRALRSRREALRDVTIRGAGMESTLILVDDLSTRVRLTNFRIQDCTVYGRRGGIFDLRSEKATFVAERVRFLGFDTGAGGSSLINTRGIAMYFRDCHIIGGYGRGPVHGQLFDVRTDAMLARFDRCRFELLSLRLHFVRSRATVVFNQCTMRDLLDSEIRPKKGVVFDATTPLLFEGNRTELTQKDLNALFPNWQSRVERK